MTSAEQNDTEISEPTKKISLSLEENAHSYLNEAVAKALQATDDLRHWQFAIVHLVQSLELSLKSLLAGIHKILVYENVDNPRYTVSIKKAILRLEEQKIKGIEFGKRDKDTMLKAIDLRNQITHSEFEFSEPFAEKKFFQLYNFLVYFQSRYLDSEIEDIIPEQQRAELLAIDRIRSQLLDNAIDRIAKEEIGEDFILDCPDCMENTFVAWDEINTCYLCRHSDDDVTLCSHCDKHCFDWQLISFAESINYYHEEGRIIVHDNYGYSDYNACPSCHPRILKNIEQQEDIINEQYDEERRYWEYEQSLKQTNPEGRTK